MGYQVRGERERIRGRCEGGLMSITTYVDVWSLLAQANQTLAMDLLI